MKLSRFGWSLMVFVVVWVIAAGFAERANTQTVSEEKPKFYRIEVVDTNVLYVVPLRADARRYPTDPDRRNYYFTGFGDAFGMALQEIKRSYDIVRTEGIQYEMSNASVTGRLIVYVTPKR